MASKNGNDRSARRSLDRRAFVSAAGLGAGGAALSAPALAQAQPKLTWRMPSSFGRNLDALYGSAQVFINTVREITDGNFDIQWFGPGEIVPPLAIAQGVQNGTVEIGQTASFYYVGIDPTYAIGSGLPFSMNVRGHAAWLVNGGGDEVMDQFYKSQNLLALFAGNTGAQSAGWFRKEIKSISDFRGLKMRIVGIAGQVFAASGGVPQQIAPGDIYAALERGTIDGTKFTSPIDDEKLGFVKVAPYYYFPAWNDGGTAVHMFVNRQKWAELPKSYQGALRAAAARAGEYCQTKYDAENPKAVRRIVAQGAQIRFLPDDVIEALSRSASGIYADLAANNANFKRAYDPYSAFARELYVWWQVSELSYDAMMVRQMRRG